MESGISATPIISNADWKNTRTGFHSRQVSDYRAVLSIFEGCINEEDAKRREHYLKTTQGRKFLGLRLTMYTHHKKAFGMGS
jgi:hypothetical protein